LVEVDHLREPDEGVVAGEGESAREPRQRRDRAPTIRRVGALVRDLEHTDLAIAAVAEPERSAVALRRVRAGEAARHHAAGRAREDEALAARAVPLLPRLRAGRLVRETRVHRRLG